MLIHSHIAGHLGGFQILAIRNKTAVNKTKKFKKKKKLVLSHEFEEFHSKGMRSSPVSGTGFGSTQANTPFRETTPSLRWVDTLLPRPCSNPRRHFLGLTWKPKPKGEKGGWRVGARAGPAVGTHNSIVREQPAISNEEPNFEGCLHQPGEIRLENFRVIYRMQFKSRTRVLH